MSKCNHTKYTFPFTCVCGKTVDDILAELEAKVERLENSHRERLEASTRWLWALQEIVDGDYEHIDEVVAIAQKAMEGK